MNRALVLMALSLFLAACGTSPAKDDSPASDLDALVASVKENAPKRTLPNGKIYCVEDSKNNDERDDCALDLEDLVWLRERDLARVVRVVEQGIERLRRQRSPCGWWGRTFGLDRCDPSAPVDDR